MNCAQIMTQNPECCEPMTTVERVARLMEVREIGPLPVVDNLESKKLVGIVTDRDLALKIVAKGRDPHNTRVCEVMSKGVVACRPDDDIELAVKMMEQWRVRRIPVIGENGKLLGIITESDIVNRLHNPAITQQLLEHLALYQ